MRGVLGWNAARCAAFLRGWGCAEMWAGHRERRAVCAAFWRAGVHEKR